jgi:defect in organelle trafficking protein DotD
MKNKICVCILAFIICSGCAETTVREYRYHSPSDDASIKLAEAATSVHRSMLEVARIEKVVIPKSKDNILTIPNVKALQMPVSLDWSGPIAEITRRLALIADFKYRELGHAPAIPVLVAIKAREKTLADVLRNLDYQALTKASIYVYPEDKVVELRYANV